ncbi:MAG: methyltransferase domain-containing protein [Gammaproteobacteria bacterium]|nr:MAG: methyltransferase domain-containing protein [Gammaproteobacteria bacterium]
MSLRHAYTLWAPIYDRLVKPAFDDPRPRSLARLQAGEGERVLLPGIGTGLDIPHLPPGPSYVGVDLTPAMLERARQRACEHDCDIELYEGDVRSLPFEDESFDHAVMHLILAVVPEPERALAEVERVLRPGGQVLVFDKFLRPGQRAPLRRLINPLVSRLATRTNLVFEDLLPHAPGLVVEQDEPAAAGGWFRFITLRKQDAQDGAPGTNTAGVPD